jgi:DNA-binding FadR family transcriptional regulator
VRGVVDRLRDYVANGRWAVGDPLPPQVELAQRFRVSRSVLREAVAALKAEGLLTSRRGAGVFVAAPAPPPFRLSGDTLGALPGILAMQELRAAVEIEAAGLAAQRRSGAQAESVRAAFERIDATIHEETDAIEADFGFHLAIAEATGNPRFPEFLAYMRGLLIPRQQVRLQTDPAAGHAGYLRMLQREHGEIEQAIRVGDAVEARAAMRRHLVDGAQRYRRWAQEDEKRAAAL